MNKGLKDLQGTRDQISGISKELRKNMVDAQAQTMKMARQFMKTDPNLSQQYNGQYIAYTEVIRQIDLMFPQAATPVKAT